LSTIFAPILLNIGEEGGVENMLRRDAGVRNGVYIYNGSLTNEVLAKMFKLPYKDINLLMAAM
jgi:alanine dehydrogenase